MRVRLLPLCAVFLLLLFFLGSSPLLQSSPALAGTATDATRQTAIEVELLGEVTFPTGYMISDTEVGGLSGLAYNAEADVYYALSDDRSQTDPARFYSLTIEIADGDLQDGDVVFQGVTTLLNGAGDPFPALSLDPEGITLTVSDTLFISSEGDANATPPLAPFVNEFALDGQLLDELPVPDKFLPAADDSSGIRQNLAFESLTLSPDGRYLTTATENALVQDGPAADVEQESLSRMLRYDLTSRQPGQEWVYTVEPVAASPVPTDSFRTNGLVELLATDNNGTFLALERSFSTGVGNTVRLYEAQTQGALDVQSAFDLFYEDGDAPFEIDPPVRKRLLADMADLGITPDNLEALAFGPDLTDGRRTLIVVSDNNFSATQVTQVLAFAVQFQTIPAALPSLETPQTIDDSEAESLLQGDSDDPAIWVHPTNPAQSIVITTLKDGGMVVFDMNGAVLQTILPAPFGDIRYNNVDLVYNFELSGETVELAVASDRQNDTLAVFQIDAATRQLTDITADTMLTTIFGVDDGEATAYGLTTYTSPDDGRVYAFVTQAGGNLIAQLELTATTSGEVTASVVRTLELPSPTGNAEDSQSEGLVVDRQLGFLYVAMETEVGLLKGSAEPDGGDQLTVIHSVDEPYLEPDIEGLTIYYGAEEEGYLLVSSQGDHTYAVFERSGNNAYLGSFLVGDQDDTDQANESDGADVLNVPLGRAFPNGLLVVQDGADDPQVVAEDDEELENTTTNFKFVPWEQVANAFAEPLLIDPTTYDPREQGPTSIALDSFQSAPEVFLPAFWLGGLVLGLVAAWGWRARRR